MKKNVASQNVSGKLVGTDGAAVTVGATLTVNKDGAGQVSGAGTLTHEGAGEWLYVPTQAETNADHVAFYFEAAGAISWLAQVYTTFPQTVDVGAGVDVVSISGDTTAADNLELMYDGTGYVDDTAPASRQQIGALSVGAGGVSTTADSFVLTTGTVASGTVGDTTQDNGVYHIVDDDAGATDLYYEFDVGGAGIPQSVEWNGYAQANNDSYSVYFWNWGGAAWEQVGTIDAANGTAEFTQSFNATIAHVGTGLDLGLVRWRVASADGVSFATDRVIVSYTFSPASIGYVGGAVWLDTNVSNIGTEPYVDGTADNPVSTLSAARTLLDALNLSNMHVSPGSSFTLASAWEGFDIYGYDYTVDLDSRSVSGTRITAATVVGNDSGANANFTVFQGCVMTTHTFGKHILVRCALTGTITLAEAGSYTWDNCTSLTANVPAVIDYGAAAGVKNVNVQDYSGSIQIESMGDLAADILSLGGDGQFTEGTCTGGTVAIAGNFTVAGVTNLTLLDDARYDVTQVNSAVFNTVVPEDFSAAGGDATLTQMLHEIRQGLGQFSIAGTTLTVQRKDGSTVAMTFTLDDASNPTSRTRAT